MDMMMDKTTAFHAFADDTASTVIDHLTLENQGDRLSLYGSLQITCDQKGLAHAQQLQHILTQAIDYLQQQKQNNQLPEQLHYPHHTVKNPFL